MSKSKMEQIFDYLKTHPESTGEAIEKALPAIGASCASLLSQLEKRKLIKSEKKYVTGRKGRFSKKLLRHYSTAKETFSLEKPKEPPKLVFPPSIVQPAILTLENATQLQLIEQLLKLQRETIRKEIETIVSEKITSALAETGGEGNFERVETLLKKEEQTHLKRYFIVGLLPEQVFIVAKKLEGLCELRFWKDESTDKLRSHAAWSDTVVIMTKFVSHSTQEVIKKTGEKMLQCNGGVTDLIFQVKNSLNIRTEYLERL